MTTYAVHATIEIKKGEWRRVHQVPTFYLHSHVQGILNEAHAARVRRALCR